jgi:hypothetical protein
LRGEHLRERVDVADLAPARDCTTAASTALRRHQRLRHGLRVESGHAACCRWSAACAAEDSAHSVHLFA